MGMFNKSVLKTIENFTRNIKKIVKILKVKLREHSEIV